MSRHNKDREFILKPELHPFYDWIQESYVSYVMCYVVGVGKGVISWTNPGIVLLVNAVLDFLK